MSLKSVSQSIKNLWGKLVYDSVSNKKEKRETKY